jgi:amidase
MTEAVPEVPGENLDLAQLQDAMATGTLSSAGMVEAYLERIQRLDRPGPDTQGLNLNAILVLNKAAHETARALDLERQAGQSRGILHGIPVLLKGNINTGDSMPTTAGSLALAGFLPGRDAPLVARLRQAGAVILGKTNLSEWANFRSTLSSSGWSSEGGQTRNPHALDRSPSGSSSGSAVAVAANLSVLAVGTETDGSVISPASANGIAGIKPSLGLVSAEGIIPISHNQDTAGPMARNLADALQLLLAMGNPGELSASGLDKPVLPRAAGKRIGFAVKLAGFHPEVDALMNQAIRALEALGATVEDTDLDCPAELSEAEEIVLQYDFNQDLDSYLHHWGPAGSIRSLEDVIAWNEANAALSMPWFGQDILKACARRPKPPGTEYKEALATCRRLSRDEGIDRAVRSGKLDAILAPSGGPAWKIDLVTGDHFMGGSSSLPAVAGYPNLTIPAGFVHELPVGVSLFGPARSEARLISIGLALEQALMARRPPRFIHLA